MITVRMDDGVARWVNRLRAAAKPAVRSALESELGEVLDQAVKDWPRDTGESARDLYLEVRDGLSALGCRAPYASHIRGGETWARVEAAALLAVQRAQKRTVETIARAGR